MEELLQRYLDDNKIYSLEGERGLKGLTKVFTEVCGYDDKFGGVLRNFFADNPGACQAVIDWIGTTQNIDWKQHLEDLVGAEEEDSEAV